MIALPDPAPRDVVPTATPWTIRTLAVLNKLFDHDREVTYAEPGRVLEDVDGVPVGIEPPTTGRATLGVPTLHIRELEHLDLTASEARRMFPNLHIYDPSEDD